MQAAHLDARYLAVRSSDTYGRAKYLRSHAEGILAALKDFQRDFQQALPPTAIQSIRAFVKQNGNLINDTSPARDAYQERVWTTVVGLGALETEISFLLSDPQEFIRARSELAFSHLQRLIVVDRDVQQKWKRAFDKGETECEKFGGVHLLHHGIWAFKVNAAGGRTDLVFPEPLERFSEQLRNSIGLILTEWKKADFDDKAEDRFAEARKQAGLYAGTVLSGIELRLYRYPIVVSRNQVNTPADCSNDGVVYRHINVAVDPLPPSRLVTKKTH
jgi:hypothetical protein